MMALAKLIIYLLMVMLNLSASRKKAMGGGVMDMTRMKYLKGGQV